MDRLLVWLLVIMLTCQLNAQQGSSDVKNTITKPSQTDSVAIQEKDSLTFDWVYLSDMGDLHTFIDTGVNFVYHQYLPLASDGLPYLDLGNPGSPTRSVTYQPKVRTTYQLGVDVFDPYYKQARNTRFALVNRPVANLSFGQYVGRGSNFITKAHAAQRFANDLYLNLDFDRTKHAGLYQNQVTSNSSLSLGLMYRNDTSRYSSVINFVQNATSYEENGGVLDRNEFGLPFASFRDKITVRLNGNLRNQNRTLTYISNYLLGGKESGVAAVHELDFSTSYYRYSDDNLSGRDSLFYADYVNDYRGIRLIHKSTQVSTLLGLKRTKRKGFNGTLGLRYQYSRVSQGLSPQHIHDLNILAKTSVPISKSIAILATGDVGVGSNLGLFDIDANADLNIGKVMSLKASFRSYRSRPQYFAEHVVINQKVLVDRSLEPEVGTKLAARLTIPSLNTSIGVSQRAVLNAIYLDDKGTFVQAAGTYLNTLFSVDNHIKVGRFGLFSRAVYQLESEDIYALPSWSSIHDLYYQNRIFKGSMDARIGVEYRAIPSYSTARYQPVVSEYFLGSQNEDSYPLLIAYVAGQVSKFRFKLKVQNTWSYFSNQIYYPTTDYPYVDATVRLSVSWLLLD